MRTYRGSNRRLQLCSVLSLGSLAGLLWGCSTQLTGTTFSGTAEPTNRGDERAAPELAACKDSARPMRIAFIVDNTGSNGATPGEVVKNAKGTDTVKRFVNQQALLQKPDLQLFDKEETYTHRQIAVFQAIAKLQRAAAEARAKNPAYEGIDIGVAHFPFAREGLAIDDVAGPDDVDLSRAVFHNGGDTGLPTPMSELSKQSGSESWKRQVWNTLKFTHYSRGMTPYATAFEAAKELLLSPQNLKAGDKRPNFVFLITDGLPTDQIPSKIVAARAALGKETRVHVLSIFKEGADVDSQNAPAKASLEAMYKMNMGYGEGYPNFEAYWSALKKIPSSPEVSDSYKTPDAKNVAETLLAEVDAVLKCSGGSK